MSTTAARNAPDPNWGGGPNPATSDDLAWWEATGMCGGCGHEDCHPDQPCGEKPFNDPLYGHRLICDHCPDRKAQGLA